MITLMKTLLLAGALAVATASAAYAGGMDGGVLGDSKAAHGDGKAAHPGSHHRSGTQHRGGHNSAAPKRTKTVAPARVFPICSPFCTGVDHPW
jgi:hypothetical protein